MILPGIDVGLMNEHLATHRGIMNKLKHYNVMDPYLKQMMISQLKIMKDHVNVMLELLKPTNNHWLQVMPVDQTLTFTYMNQNAIYESDKPIILEMHDTAKFMAQNNFTSALMMKNQNVKHVHFDMAHQQVIFMQLYETYIEKRDWSFAPKSTAEEQIKTINHFWHIASD